MLAFPSSTTYSSALSTYSTQPWGFHTIRFPLLGYPSIDVDGAFPLHWQFMIFPHSLPFNSPVRPKLRTPAYCISLFLHVSLGGWIIIFHFNMLKWSSLHVLLLVLGLDQRDRWWFLARMRAWHAATLLFTVDFLVSCPNVISCAPNLNHLTM